MLKLYKNQTNSFNIMGEERVKGARTMKSQNLTPQQYRKTNGTMYLIMVLNCILCAGIDISNMMKGAAAGTTYVRCIIYFLFIPILGAVVKIFGDKKLAMVIMAVSYLTIYPIVVFGNGVGTLALAFPVLVGFMIYLNARVILLGCVSTFIICAIKCAMVKAGGDVSAFGIGNVITMAMIICIFASYRAINLLILFDKENREEVETEAKRREEVAVSVAGIVERLDNSFQSVMSELDNIGEAMSTAHMTMESIAGSSEDTARAVNQQADMTGQIQAKLENTNATAIQAMGTTSELKEVVKNGKQLADDLHKQSVLVDENTSRISETVALLVENVQKVSGITESILNISSQTNLLALNASIEAARAGEAGRGFAVVADQIRNLAEETKVSTEKITVIINELTAITGETQQGIEESVESINVQRRKVEEVNESFTQVEAGMLELGAGVESMSGEVEEVLEANKVIVESIDMLSSTSEEVSAETQNSKSHIDTAFDSLNLFCETFQGAFEELENLKQTACN